MFGTGIVRSNTVDFDVFYGRKAPEICPNIADNTIVREDASNIENSPVAVSTPVNPPAQAGKQ